MLSTLSQRKWNANIVSPHIKSTLYMLLGRKVVINIYMLRSHDRCKRHPHIWEYLLFRSRMKDTGLMAFPVLAKAWMMWFCITQIIQKPDWWPEKQTRKTNFVRNKKKVSVAIFALFNSLKHKPLCTAARDAHFLSTQLPCFSSKTKTDPGVTSKHLSFSAKLWMN